MKKTIIAAALAICALTGCKTEYELLLESSDSNAKFAAAMDFFNAGKFSRSAQLFESLAAISSGTERDDTVQYYWGLSNYRQKDYWTAETNFKSFMDNFPRSPFAEPAEFYYIDCLFRSTLRWELDQTPTYNAISGIAHYKMTYPTSERVAVCDRMLEDLEERLDRKAYENAKLYYTMEDYKASRLALKNVLKDDADNLYREDILYLTAMSSYKYAQLSVPEKQRERYLVFIDDYFNFVGEYPESKKRAELDRLYRLVKDR